ncbi:hypothetical protein ACFFRR_007212, partial [Megaselia abdita]
MSSELSEPFLPMNSNELTKHQQLKLWDNLDFVDQDKTIPSKLKKCCLRLSFEDFIAETNIKNSGIDPKYAYSFFQSTEIWPEKITFIDLVFFLKKSLTWLEFENLRIMDISPKYFSFKLVHLKTNFIDVVSNLLEFEISNDLALKVFELCQDQDTWPINVELNQNWISNKCSNESSLDNIFDPTITSTQYQKGKSQETESQSSEPSSILSSEFSENGKNDDSTTVKKKKGKARKPMPVPLQEIKTEDTIQPSEPLSILSSLESDFSEGRILENDENIENKVPKRLRNMDTEESTPASKKSKKKCKKPMPVPLPEIKTEVTIEPSSSRKDKNEERNGETIKRPRDTDAEINDESTSVQKKSKTLECIESMPVLMEKGEETSTILE